MIDEAIEMRFQYKGKITVNYGYYRTKNNEVSVPDYYSSNNIGKSYEWDGGTWFGIPYTGTDWCFVKKITDNWYYYELHWG